MAIPGQYQYPTPPGGTPAPTPTPTPTPTPGGGGAGGFDGWWGKLFGGTANLPDWLKTMLQKRYDQTTGGATVGGWPTGEAASGWWGGADDLAKIKAMLPSTLPDLRNHGPSYDAQGNWSRPGGITPIPAGTFGGGTPSPGFDAEAYLARVGKGKKLDEFTPGAATAAAQQTGGSTYFGGGGGGTAAATAGGGLGGTSSGSGLGWLSRYLGR